MKVIKNNEVVDFTTEGLTTDDKIEFKRYEDMISALKALSDAGIHYRQCNPLILTII